MLVLAVQAVFLANALRTYFVGDDGINRSSSGALANDGVSFFTAVDRVVSYWWTVQGRFFPMSFYEGYLQAVTFHDARAYKALLIVWTLAAGLCVWLLLRELGASRAIASLALLVATIAMQFRPPQDPILAYAGLEQIVLGEVALSLMFFHRWLRLGRRTHLALAVGLFVLASITYESSYVYGPLYAVLALVRRRHVVGALRALVPIIVPSVVLLAVGSYGRAHATIGGDGPYAPSFDPHEVLATFGDQFSAAVPLSYAGFDPTGALHPFGTVLIARMGAGDLLIGLLFALAAAAVAWRAPWASRDWDPRLIAAIGLILWVLTAAPIAIATRYQAELVRGLGHIPVIIECFAFGLVVVGLAGWAARRVPPSARHAVRLGGVAALAVAVGALAAVGHRANAVVVAGLQPSRTVGLTLEETAAGPVKARVAGGSRLLVDPADAGNSAAFYRQYSGRKLAVGRADGARVAAVAARSRSCSPARASTWWLRAGTVTPTGGWSLLTCAGGPGAVLSLHGLDPRTTLVGVRTLAADARRAPRAHFGLAGDVRLDAADAGVIDPYSFGIVAEPEPVAAEWVAGCWPAEATPKGTGRLCEGDAVLKVVETAGAPARVTVTLPVVDAGRGMRSLTVTDGERAPRTFATGGPAAAVAVSLPAHGARTLRVRANGGRALDGVSGGRVARWLTGPAPSVVAAP